MRLRRVLASLSIFIFLLTPALVVWQQRTIRDWWILRSYTPTAAVVQLSNDVTMTQKAQHVFYVSRPQLQHKTDFQKSCTTTEQTIVLGCYKANEGIYIYDVDDVRLAGVQQVTAVHEMLHAAYDRLSSKERRHVDALVQQAYEGIKNERITKNVDAYRKKDATVVPNELHSILGSEVQALPAELEQYYSRYFSDRQEVVRYSESYENEFSEREKQVASYDAQLEALRQRYDTLKAKIVSEESELSTLIASLNASADSSDVANYNAKVTQYRRLYSTYTSDISAINAIVATYKTILEKRNAIALEEQSLLQAIDTRASTSP